MVGLLHTYERKTVCGAFRFRIQVFPSLQLREASIQVAPQDLQQPDHSCGDALAPRHLRHLVY